MVCEKEQMKVLLVDNHDSFLHNIVQILREQGGATVEVQLAGSVALSSLPDYDAVVFSPGPDIVDPGGDMAAILDLLDETVPVLGVCLGYDIIASYFGGRLNNLHRNYHGVTAKVRLLEPENPLFAGLPETIEAGLYHSWEVEGASLPPVLKPCAVSEDRVLMAFRHVARPIYGVQFHPESIMTPWGGRILCNFLQVARGNSSVNPDDTTGPVKNEA